MHTYFNWSSGKDSALALYKILQSGVKIDKLLTTVNKSLGRVTMHGLKLELLYAQAKETGIPLELLELPDSPTMEEYNTLMQNKVNQLKSEGYNQCVFGDIFLEDLKKYREEKLAESDIKPLFPLWKQDTTTLVNELLDLGFKTKIVSLNLDLLPFEFVGEGLTKELLKEFPKNVDPCGENGEFHTFCYAGPIYQNEIKTVVTEKVKKAYPRPNGEGKVEYGFAELDLVS